MPADENDEPANLDVTGNIHSNGAFRVSSSAQDLIFAGFEINSAVAVANYDPETTADPGILVPLDLQDPLNVRVYFDGSLSNELLGASFTAKGDLATNGTGELTLALSSNDDSFNYNGLTFEIPEGSSTVELRQELVGGNLTGSVWFDGEILDVPGMPADENDEPAKLDVTGNIHSNGAFRVSSSAQDLIFAGFEINSAVAVANYDHRCRLMIQELSFQLELQLVELLNVRVYFDGSLSNELLGASFTAKGDLATDGTGELTLALSSNDDSFNYNGLTFEIPEGSSTVELRQGLVGGNLTGSVWFDGEILDVPGMPADENDEPAKLDVTGNIHSNGAFRVSSSAQDLIFAGFEINSAVAVANYDPETTADPGILVPLDLQDPLNVRVYFDGSLSNELLGASFTAKGDLATDGTGELTLALSSNDDSFNYNGLTFEIPEGSSTVELRQEVGRW